MRKKNARFVFGKNVKAFRKQKGWTQAELARRAELSVRHIQKIESHQPPDVTLDTIEKLARALEIDCWNIVKG